MRSNILAGFSSLLSTLQAEYTTEQQTIVACPSQEQLAQIQGDEEATQAHDRCGLQETLLQVREKHQEQQRRVGEDWSQ